MTSALSASPKSREPAGSTRRRTPQRAGTAPQEGRARSTRIVLGLLAVYSLFPLVWLFISAGKPTTDLISGDNLSLTHFQYWTNITDLFTYDGGIFLRWVANTLLYAGVGALASVLMSAAAGFALSKYSFPGKRWVGNAILAGVMVPTSALVLPIYLMLGSLHLTNTFWGVFAASLAHPFGVYLCRVFADASVPDEVLEAARVDGSSEWKLFWRVSLPMMRDGLITVALLQFVAIWNNYFLPLVLLNDKDLYPVTLGLANLNLLSRQTPDQYRLVLVGALVATVPLILAFVFLQRYWRSGMTSGAVK
ncbi:carbohydrate ABC transporter permease [Streptomyces sp. NPDC102360]|uniref:carbohydrate ABC transporter permease n=1 Tax=Streptomyces sp. NPDC102360 TaxID=3366160 RepID=UPI0037F61B39